jgi:hypothetical protein
MVVSSASLSAHSSPLVCQIFLRRITHSLHRCTPLNGVYLLYGQYSTIEHELTLRASPVKLLAQAGW